MKSARGACFITLLYKISDKNAGRARNNGSAAVAMQKEKARVCIHA